MIGVTPVIPKFAETNCVAKISALILSQSGFKTDIISSLCTIDNEVELNLVKFLQLKGSVIRDLSNTHVI